MTGEDASTAFRALDEKVREARELIGRLRERNQALATEIEELKGRLADDGQPAPLSREPADAAPELRVMRREREEIRERLSHLLKQLEEI